MEPGPGRAGPGRAGPGRAGPGRAVPGRRRCQLRARRDQRGQRRRVVARGRRCPARPAASTPPWVTTDACRARPRATRCRCWPARSGPAAGCPACQRALHAEQAVSLRLRRAAAKHRPGARLSSMPLTWSGVRSGPLRQQQRGAAGHDRGGLRGAAAALVAAADLAGRARGVHGRAGRPQALHVRAGGDQVGVAGAVAAGREGARPRRRRSRGCRGCRTRRRRARTGRSPGR